jgi:hypothetical protein
MFPTIRLESALETRTTEVLFRIGLNEGEGEVSELHTHLCQCDFGQIFKFKHLSFGHVKKLSLCLTN